MDAKPAIIRDAYPGEGRVVMNVWRAAFQEDDLHGDLAQVESLIEGETTGRLFVAEVDGKMVGTLIATYDGWRGNMYRIAVLPACQRRGIAGQLVREAEVWLSSLGCRRITALVIKDNTWATRFWQSAGYELEDSMGRFARNLG